MSLRGYWRTLIVFIACNPAMRMTKLTTIASTGRLMKRSVNDFMSILGIDWLWIQLRFGRELVVDRHRHSVAQFENTCADNGLAAFQAVSDRHKITARFADFHKLLPDRLRFFTGLVVFLFLDHENRIAKWRIGNGRAGNDECLVFFRQLDFHFREHSRSQRD